MSNLLHHFHIPVMGTGHSVDTAIRVAPFGIDSVISLVDDLLLERIRKHYAALFDLPYTAIKRHEEDGRAKRIREYLNTVHDVVAIKFEAIKALPFFQENDKQKYFEMLPDDSELKKSYLHLLTLTDNVEKVKLSKELTAKMLPGSIDVNIMVKLDKVNHTPKGELLPDEQSDAKAAMRGFATSKLHASMIFSAGINQTLYTYMSKYKDFYRDASGYVKKKIIIKISDFRSALIQGKFLAKKGLEVYEFRVESGLNCGGHAFASNGQLLPTLMKEISEKRHQLPAQFFRGIKSYFEKNDLPLHESAATHEPLVTVQGGIGTHGEVERLTADYGVDLTGWASPFLLVPEATPIDDTTREQLRDADISQFYLSQASPLGVPFNNFYISKSEQWRRERIEKGTAGSPCPKKFLVSNTEFTEMPICTASTEYQKLKLEQIAESSLSEAEKQRQTTRVYVKSCICDHLGNGALVDLDIAKESRSPQSICPGPNTAWFTKFYTLKEMIDHIYGRTESLVPAERPHMYAKELEMYVDYYQNEVDNMTAGQIKELGSFHKNLLEGIEYVNSIAQTKAYKDENLASIPATAEANKVKLQHAFESYQAKTAAFQAEQD